MIDRVTATAGPETSPARCATALTRVAFAIEALMPPPNWAAAVIGTAGAMLTGADLTVSLILPPPGAGTGTVRAGIFASVAWLVSGDEAEVFADAMAAAGETDAVETAAAADTDGVDGEEQAERTSADARPIVASIPTVRAVSFTMGFQTGC